MWKGEILQTVGPNGIYHQYFNILNGLLERHGLENKRQDLRELMLDILSAVMTNLTNRKSKLIRLRSVKLVRLTSFKDRETSNQLIF